MLRKISGKLNLIGVILVAMAFVPVVASAAELSGTQLGDVYLTEDTTLTGDVILGDGMSLNVASGKTVTLDLNGFTIDKNGARDYAINNQGVLTIVDNGATKGKITCESDYSSCVRNAKTLVMDGVTVEAVYTALKTEELTTTTVKDSSLTSSLKRADGDTAGTIMNYGTTTVENSKISNTAEGGVAVYALTYLDYSSSITVNNSDLEADQAVQTFYDDGAAKPTQNTTKANVVLNGGTISEGSIINVRPIDDTTPSNATVKVEGEITAPISVLPYAQADTKITLNTDVTSGDVEIPADVTLVVPEGVEFKAETLTNNGTIETDDNREIINGEAVEKAADYSKVEEALEKASKIDESLYTEESVKALTDAVAAVVPDKKISEQAQVDAMAKAIEDAIKALEVKPSEPVVDPEEPVVTPDVPQTSDNVLTYVTSGLLSALGLAVVIKKRFM